ncbi:hypothetical protein [Viridibacterium curvum]|uniref:Uncharacterized protein n=1 Tax=Viridibacterium curvum TaxID=1101404 RepID=A0ABP9QAY6_9RHOO
MLSLRDCLDYCDLTEEEVELFALHEHLPHEVAATVACSLVQTEDGVGQMDLCLAEMVQTAIRDGQLAKAEHVLHVYAQFRSAHPLAH